MRQRPRSSPPRPAARFAADDRGAAAIVLVVALPVMIGGMALGAEAGYWFMGQRELQQAADVAAHAAGVKLRSGADEDEMHAAALDVANASGFEAGTDTLTLANPPGSGGYAGEANSVAVTLVREQPRYFTRIYSSEPVEIGARAVTAIEGGTNACLLALSGSAPGAVTVAGSTEVTFEGCDVMSNSTASDSFLMQGGGAAVATTGCVNTVGGTVTTAGLTMTGCAQPNEGAPPAADPYAGVEEPKETGTTCQDGSRQNETLDPSELYLGVPTMRFCSDLDLSGDVILEPGLYIIDPPGGGTFNVNSNASITGSGVTFFLADGVNIKFNGSADFDLSAPESGPYSGLLFFGSRSATSASHEINGTAGAVLNGAVYTPASHMDFRGDFTGSGGGCTQIVTGTVTFSGNSALEVDCQAVGTKPVKLNEHVRLVE